MLDSLPMPPFRNRIAALLAVLAMVLQGFLPLVAQAQAAGPDFLGSICSVDGTGAPDAAGGAPLPDEGAGKHQKHCALCDMGGDRAAALAAASVPAFHVAAHEAVLSPARPAAQLRSTAVSPAQPRAPPPTA